MNLGFYFRLWALFAALCLASRSRTGFSADYSRDIKPIVAENCTKCHGPSQHKGNLRLDTAELIKKGGEAGPILVPGESKTSILIQVLRGEHASIPQMPYKKAPLAEAQIVLIGEWIDEGAPAPVEEKSAERVHWAFVPPARPDLPALKEKSRVSSPVDYFIQAKLEAQAISPAPEADRRTLLRRVSLDLIGIPPTPEEIEEFVNDCRPDAFERQVDRLLASPHYGERWGRWWLDAARYADSNGYSIDAPRQIWKYRDWVVSALNQDKSFDQFVVEQLAGDLLPNPTIGQRVATGFNRNTQINQEGGIDPEQFRVESVMDRVNTFGTVFLGLTIGCAQCHDHKFDPISQREYYQLFAFFNSTEEDGHGKAAPSGMLEVPGEFEPLDEGEVEEARAELNRYLNTKGSEVLAWEEKLSEQERSALPSDIRSALGTRWSDRTVPEKRSVYRAFKGSADAQFKSRDEKVTKLEGRSRKPVSTLVMQERKEPRDTFVLTKGDFTRPSEKVSPGVPAMLNRLLPLQDRRANRLDLARWVVALDNPMLARVIVNRVWQQYFGRGLVETENDFGTQGSPPSHPELLDWLASEFARPSSSEAQAWSLKHLHRLIVVSATYRQSSKMRSELLAIDPNNRLLARQSRLRLDAELIRDSALAISGLLSPEIGGPPVFPPQPDGVMNLGQVKREWRASSGGQRYRRAIYTQFWRATPHPALSVFDSADGFSSCTRRIRSNTPLQALTLLNDQQYFEFARALALRIRAVPGNDAEKLRAAFRLALGRDPSLVEQRRLAELPRDGTEKNWGDVARILLNLDETITRE